MSKLEGFTEGDSPEIKGYLFNCPGCGGHAVHIKPFKNELGASWEFNNDTNKPTFSPSILSQITSPSGKRMVCHSFVTDGKIRFLSDCTHELRGQEVELPEYE